MGHLPGAKKSDFLFRGAKADEPQGSRAGLILLIPAGEVSLGSPRVGTIHLQAPTPHTPPLQVPRVRTVVRGERASRSIVNRTTALWSIYIATLLILAGSTDLPVFT